MNRRGFTLIELLVVISIIALLVAILLPVLGSARDVTRTAHCLSNQRQIAVAFNGYAVEFRDYTPGSKLIYFAPYQDPNLDLPPTFPLAGAGADWSGRLGVGGFAGGSTTYTGYNVSYQTTLTNWLLFRDPGEQITYNDAADPSPSLYVGNGAIAGTSYNRWTWFYTQNSYAVNFEIVRYFYGAVRRGFSKGPQLARTSDAALVTDGGAYNTFFLDDIDHDASFWDYPRGRYAYRHGGLGAINVLYWDGHAATRRHRSETGKPIWNYLYQPGTAGDPLP
jgi:prepilin-type N-terminal cleavage/methylation domain-containing protein/prepilin-type processing-associated H-X9-DG protein